MRDYKWGKMLLVMLLSGVVGATVASVVENMKDVGGLENIKVVLNQFTPNLFWIALVCGIIGIIGYVYFNNLFKKDGYSNDEGSLYDRYENKMSIVMTFSTVCAIINFTALGLNLSQEIGKIYVIIFLVNGILALMGEVATIALVKKVRPDLNADPLDGGFKREYFDRLDECEKNKVGKASFKTISIMVPVYVTMFAVCLLIIMLLEVSPIICIPVGILWLIQTVVMVYYSCKQK